MKRQSMQAIVSTLAAISLLILTPARADDPTTIAEQMPLPMTPITATVVGPGVAAYAALALIAAASAALYTGATNIAYNTTSAAWYGYGATSPVTPTPPNTSAPYYIPPGIYNPDGTPINPSASLPTIPPSWVPPMPTPSLPQATDTGLF